MNASFIGGIFVWINRIKEAYEMILDEMTRRQIRYWLFRFRTETEENGASAEGSPEGLREKFEDMEWFQNWENFGITWDVHDEDFFRIVPLKQSLSDQWNRVLEEKVPELIKDETHNEKITKKKTKKKSKKKTKK